MTVASVARSNRNPFERIFDALIDPARSERAMLLLLAGYVAAWSLYGAIAKSSQDLHFDIGEMFAWSHQVGLSAPTHPPLGAWLVRLWFTAMPRQDWSFYLFAILVATVALWIAWRLASRYLTPEKRVLGLALLTLLPFYNFHALKFNASSVLTPFWAATTWWFLLSFDTRRAGWAALAGIGAGAAMLGKYWSIFLLAGLGLAAVMDSRRAAYFGSLAPWVTIAAGAAVLMPHLFFIATHGFTTVGFAFTSHATTFASAARDSLYFLASVAGYIAAPIVLGALATTPSAAAIKDTLAPSTPERRMVLVAFAAPIFLAALAGVAARAQLDPLWSMSAMTLLPVVLFGSPLVAVKRAAAVGVLAFAIVFPLVMVAASPVIAFVIHRQGVPNYASHYRLIAQAVEQAWRAQTNEPLRIVGGNRPVVDGSNIYFTGRPATFVLTEPARTPWVDKARIEREGIAIVCPETEISCLQEMNAYAGRYGAKINEVSIARSFLGTTDTPVKYRIAIIPPR
jgi:hypothetical protein